jgi:predicted transcriptional regulator
MSAMDVMDALRESDHPLADEELADILGRDLRKVGQECRHLAFQGIVIREQHPRGGFTVNRIYSGRD